MLTLTVNRNKLGTQRLTSGMSRHFRLWEKRPVNHSFYMSLDYLEPKEWIMGSFMGTLNNKVGQAYSSFRRLESRYPYINRYDNNKPRGFYENV